MMRHRRMIHEDVSQGTPRSKWAVITVVVVATHALIASITVVVVARHALIASVPQELTRTPPGCTPGAAALALH